MLNSTKNQSNDNLRETDHSVKLQQIFNVPRIPKILNDDSKYLSTASKNVQQTMIRRLNLKRNAKNHRKNLKESKRNQ